MGLIERGRRRLRERRARRLLARARHGDPDRLAGVVTDLGALANVDGRGRAATLAVEGLAAIARSENESQSRRRATDALVEVLADDDEALANAAAEQLGYVGLERPETLDRLDPAYATVLADWDHLAHRRVAVDVAAIAVRHHRGGRDPLPVARRRLRECLLAGAREVRVDAASAYVVMADRPEVVDDAETVAGYLSILAGDLDREVPAPDTQARRVADGRTVSEAIDRLADGGDGN